MCFIIFIHILSSNVVDTFIEELNKQHNREFDLKNSLENKSSFLITVSGIVIPLLFGFGIFLIEKIDRGYHLLGIAELLLGFIRPPRPRHARHVVTDGVRRGAWAGRRRQVRLQSGGETGRQPSPRRRLSCRALDGRFQLEPRRGSGFGCGGGSAGASSRATPLSAPTVLARCLERFRRSSGSITTDSSPARASSSEPAPVRRGPAPES